MLTDIGWEFKDQLSGVIYRIMYSGSQERNNLRENESLETEGSEQGLCPICSKEEDWPIDGVWR
jgi:hypothetical protein